MFLLAEEANASVGICDLMDDASHRLRFCIKVTKEEGVSIYVCTVCEASMKSTLPGIPLWVLEHTQMHVDTGEWEF